MNSEVFIAASLLWVDLRTILDYILDYILIILERYKDQICARPPSTNNSLPDKTAVIRGYDKLCGPNLSFTRFGIYLQGLRPEFPLIITV